MAYIIGSALIGLLTAILYALRTKHTVKATFNVLLASFSFEASDQPEPSSPLKRQVR